MEHKMMKKLTAAAVAGSLVFSLAGCAGQGNKEEGGSSGDSLKIGFTANSLDNATVQEALSVLEEKCERGFDRRRRRGRN